MNKSKVARRSCTAALLSALTIALSSCSGATNTYGKLEAMKDTPYATVGDETITYKELWDELQWNSADVLEDQIDGVVLHSYLENIYNVLNKNYSDLTEEQLSAVGIDKNADGAEKKFEDLKKEYQTRIVDYVISDVFNLTFDITGYEDEVKTLSETNKLLYEEKFIDNLYVSYNTYNLTSGESVRSLINIDGIGAEIPLKDNFDNYFKIGNDEIFRQVYYIDLAKELLAFDKLTEEVDEAAEDDEDDDDDRWGYFLTSDYISKFKEEYTRLNKVNAIIIKFSTNEEYNQTMRAFGLKYYKDRFYFLKGEGYSYDKYIKFYDEYPVSKLSSGNDAIPVDDKVMIELFAQIYNYYYGGYRESLVTDNISIDASNVKLDQLRNVTSEIIDVYSTSSTTKYENAVNKLTTNYSDRENDTCTLYTKDEISDLNLFSLMYDKLDVKDSSKRFTTTTTSGNDGYYMAFKFGEQPLDSEDVENYEEYQKYVEFYNSDLSDYEILSFIQKENLTDPILKELKYSRLTESTITDYLTDAKEDIRVKIYNEATEIAYMAKNSNYSKTLTSADDSNLLASITYNDVTYNLQILADSQTIANDTDTEKTITVVGNPDKAFGVFDELEKTSGATTAIDLLSKKLIKKTKAYEKTAEDREKYLDYIDAVLYQFSNNQFSGYSSSIGKYNFLMLYFHTAVIDEIVDNYYRVQFASTDLLTDYSNDTLIDFFSDYSDKLYSNHFSLGGTRMLVYFDGNDDGKEDLTDADVKWQDYVVTSQDTDVTEFIGLTRGEIAKKMIYEVYTLIAASPKSHTERLTEIVTEIQSSARVEYEADTNPLAAENRWAKYLHLGLKVKTVELSVANSSTDCDFSIKQRLYDYARGTNEDGSKTYQYYINETTPTCFMETLNSSSTALYANDDIVMSKDGFNLILITNGTANKSAEFKEKDNTEGILTDIYFKYNDRNVIIDNIFNEEKKLNRNQIKLYILDNAVNGSSTLAPTSISEALTNYLSGVYTRFTAEETQRIILLSFIRNKAGISDTVELYDIVTFDNDSYNGVDGVLNQVIQINRRTADDYNYIYNDTTHTSNPYENWWDDINSIVSTLLLEDKE